jgi:hypothetical protein
MLVTLLLLALGYESINRDGESFISFSSVAINKSKLKVV